MSIFNGSGYTTLQLTTFLNEAQTALHELITGKKAVSIERNGRKVTFTQSTIHDLKLYIQEIQSYLNISGQRGTPARFTF